MFTELIALSILIAGYLVAGYWLVQSDKHGKKSLYQNLISCHKLWKWIGNIAAILTFLLIVYEVVAVYTEILGEFRLFVIVKENLSNTWVGFIFYVANLILVIIGSSRLLDSCIENDRLSNPTIRYAYSSTFVLVGVIFVISVTQFLIQSISTEGVGIHIIAVLILYIGIIYFIYKVLGINANFEGMQDITNSIYLKRRRSLILVFIFCTALLQTMITKAGLIIYLISQLQTKNNSNTANTTFLDDLPHRMIEATSLHRFLFFFIFSSGITCLLFWQAVITPFPPVSGNFSKTHLIGFIFTLDLFIAIFALTRPRLSVITTAAVVLTIVFTRYVLFIFTPSWFTSVSEILNIYEQLYTTFGSYVYVAAFGILIHMITCIFFFLDDYFITLKGELLDYQKPDIFKRVTHAAICMDLFLPIIVGVSIIFMSLFAINHQSDTVEHTLGSFSVYIVGMLCFIGLCLYTFNSQYQKGYTEIDKLRSFMRYIPEKKREELVQSYLIFQKSGRNKESNGLDIMILLYGVWLGFMVSFILITGYIILP